MSVGSTAQLLDVTTFVDGSGGCKGRDVSGVDHAVCERNFSFHSLVLIWGNGGTVVA